MMKKGNQLCLLALVAYPIMTYGAEVNLSVVNANGGATQMYDKDTPGYFTVWIHWDSTANCNATQLNLNMTGPDGNDANALWRVSAVLNAAQTVAVSSNAGYYDEYDNFIPTPAPFFKIFDAYTPAPSTLATGIANGKEEWLECVGGVYIEPQSSRILIGYWLEPLNPAEIEPGVYTLGLTGVGVQFGGSSLTTAITSSLQIAVLPEPASVLLLLLALPFMYRRTA